MRETEREKKKARDKRQEPARQQSKSYCQILWIWVSVCNLCPFGHKFFFERIKEKPNKDDQQGRPTEAKTQKPLAQKQILPMTTSRKNVKKNNNQCKNKYQIPYF